MMFWLFDDNRPWFRQKVYGYGAGLPIAWQGWALLALHVGVIAGLAFALQHRPLAMAAALATAAILPLPIYAARTAGGWRWRWGQEENGS
jgi:hypothetical protein